MKREAGFLFSADGDVLDNTELCSSRKSKQPNTVFLNRKDGTLDAVNLPPLGMHRGAAFGDFDSDGRIDVVVRRLTERAELLRNVSPAANHWLGLRLVGTRSNRDGIGARTRIWRPGQSRHHLGGLRVLRRQGGSLRAWRRGSRGTCPDRMAGRDQTKIDERQDRSGRRRDRGIAIAAPRDRISS